MARNRTLFRPRREPARPIREPVPLPEPGKDVGLALRQLMQTLRQNVEAAIRARGINISFAQAVVMRTLAGEPGISGAQVARRATVTAQTMNGLLRSLESSGWIVREANPESRSADSWFITRAGLDNLLAANAVVDEVLSRVFRPLSKADTARLRELLQTCTDALRVNGKE